MQTTSHRMVAVVMVLQQPLMETPTVVTHKKQNLENEAEQENEAEINQVADADRMFRLAVFCSN